MAGLHPLRQAITCANCGLQRICFPKGLTAHEVNRLDQLIAAQPHVTKGAYIFRSGEPAKGLFALKSGVVKLSRIDEQGNEIIHSFYLPGDLLGLEALDQPVYAYDAITLDTCNLCLFAQEDLEHLGQQMPSLNKQILHMMRQELERERNHLENLTYRSAEQRIAHFILSMVRRYQDRGYASEAFRLPILHRDLATFLSLTPETVSRILKKFQEKEIMRWRKKEVEIFNMARLCELAGAPDAEEICHHCQAVMG